MCPIHVEKCTEVDFDRLLEMFGHLLEDEKSDSGWDESKRVLMLCKYLHGGFHAYFIRNDEQTIGYALVNIKSTPLYLQHFFICREHRRKHFGKEAFNALLLALGTDTIDLDAFVWNSRALAFWRSLGFQDRSMMMRYHAKSVE